MTFSNSNSLFTLVDTEFSPQAAELAKQLHIELIDVPTPDCKQWLEFITDKKTQQQRLSICSRQAGPVNIDFLSGKKAHRQKFGGGKGQPLIKAMGTQENPIIMDATAGMGGDSFVLASLGFKVLMVERSPIVAALLQDALKRAQQNLANEEHEIQQSIHNLSLVNADSASYLRKTQPEVDVVYMDPMYPEKKKKAAAKKDMQALQSLVGPDTDSTKLLDAALQTARYRVVVKRPKGAPTIKSDLGDIEPNTQVSSPNTRYDIYVIKALKASGKL